MLKMFASTFFSYLEKFFPTFCSVKKDKLKKDKQKSDDKFVKSVSKAGQASSSAGSNNSVASNSSNNNSNLDRKHLHNYRVVQRNLVYVIGMPSNTASEDTVRSANYFGQYGKITKTVIHKNNNISLSTVSAYCTFWNREDAKAAIQALDGYWLEGHQLRASFGTTKYCNSFVRGVSCSNPDCVYLHDYGEDEDRYTKEDIVNPTIAVTSVNPANSSNKAITNTLITGMGGPSGTGKRPVGEPTLPPPVFTQESAIAAGNQTVIQQVAAAAAAAEKAEKAAANVGGGGAKGGKASSWAGLAAGASSDSLATESGATATATTTTSSADNLPPLHPQKAPQPGHQSIASTIAASGLSTGMSKTSKKEVAQAISPATDGVGSGRASPATTSTAPVPSPTPLTALSPSYQYNSYNGFGKCAVFPVPTSSYHLSIWHKIMHASSSDLGTNPYAAFSSLPVSDLLELTLPPVDAIGNLPMWPRPLAYYYNGSSPNRAKASGQPSQGNSPDSNPIANLTPQQLALLQQQMLQSQSSLGGQSQNQGGNNTQQAGGGQSMSMLWSK